MSGGVFIIPSSGSLRFLIDICYEFNISNLEVQRYGELYVAFFSDDLIFSFLRFIMIRNRIPCDCISAEDIIKSGLDLLSYHGYIVIDS